MIAGRCIHPGCGRAWLTTTLRAALALIAAHEATHEREDTP